MDEFEAGKSTIDAFKSITIKQAILFSKWAWDDISADIIKNCWIKTGILEKTLNLQEDEFLETIGEIDSIIKTVVQENSISAAEYIEIEREFDVSKEEITNEQIVKIVKEIDSKEEEEKELVETNGVVNDLNEIVIVTNNDAFKALKLFETYLLQNSIDEKSSKLLRDAYEVLREIKKEKGKQLSIFDFLTKEIK